MIKNGGKRLWIARNKKGVLKVFANKPTKCYSSEDIAFAGEECDDWRDTTLYFDFGSLEIGNDLYTEITFENGPQEALLLVMTEKFPTANGNNTLNVTNTYEGD